MKKVLLIAAGLLVTTVALEDVASGQIPQYRAGPQSGGGGPTLKRSTRPVVSRYTGLLGSSVGAGGGIGYQYFTRVQPQENAARAIGSLGRSVNRLQTETQNLAAGGLYSNTALSQIQAQQGPDTGLLTIAPTGHPVSYFSHRAYFGTNLQSNAGIGGGTAGGAGAGGAGAAYGGAGARR